MKSSVVALVILDGFGLRTDTYYNAISLARKPTIEGLLRSCPNIPIDGSGPAVGLPLGQMGNSEVGHLNIGAGRVVYQDITLIDKKISDGEFYANPALAPAMKALKSRGGAMHILGLVSDGCVHSSMNHLRALIHMAAMFKLPQVYLHAFTDGRDTSPTSGVGFLTTAMEYFREFGVGKLSTVVGRYYAMDRDRRWERTELAYNAMVGGQGECVFDALAAVRANYGKGITDEFLPPLIINDGAGSNQFISRGDLVVGLNFRADRMRQLCYFLTGSPLQNAPSPSAIDIDLVTMTNYDSKLSAARVAFPPREMAGILGEVVSQHGLKQLRMAETEKYPHVTFFFNGGVKVAFPGEDRILIPSPKVPTYDLQPEMSSVAVTDELCARILSRQYQFIVLNYANCDMVGHTGSLPATIAAVEAVDTGLGRVLAALEDVGGDALITADHGNAEQMWDYETNGPHTAHTTNLVPLIFFGPNKYRFTHPHHGGVLADLAPTILDLLGVPAPKEMTGKSFASSAR